MCADIENASELDAAIEYERDGDEDYFSFNAGTFTLQMSSCFPLTMESKSIEGIYDTLMQCAMISQGAGGIGVAMPKIRASAAYIRGTLASAYSCSMQHAESSMQRQPAASSGLRRHLHCHRVGHLGANDVREEDLAAEQSLLYLSCQCSNWNGFVKLPYRTTWCPLEHSHLHSHWIGHLGAHDVREKDLTAEYQCGSDGTRDAFRRGRY